MKRVRGDAGDVVIKDNEAGRPDADYADGTAGDDNDNSVHNNDRGDIDTDHDGQQAQTELDQPAVEITEHRRDEDYTEWIRARINEAFEGDSFQLLADVQPVRFHV